MRATAATELERALARSGDDLYRLALLLAPDAQRAARALVAAAQRMGATSAAVGEHDLIAALLAALPPERGRLQIQERLTQLRSPAWSRPPPERTDDGPLLRALARLPRSGRLALGLTLLRGFEPDRAAPLFGGDAGAVRAQVRDALLVLAPAVPDVPTDLLDPAQAPETCRPTRAALALGATALHNDAAVRGHLALCSACRAAEQVWLKLTTTVETALRAALRPLALPAALAEQIAQAAQPAAVERTGWFDHPRVRIALVALPVLALIAFLIFPHGAPAGLSGSGSAGPPAVAAPQDLVRRAAAQLYAMPERAGVWHSRYSIQWYFPDGTFAPLSGDIWIDAAGRRHRAQLVHQAGGGPYEFELADGTAAIWYGASESYARSIYPFNITGLSLRNKFRAPPDHQQSMLDGRLQSGAWGIAGAYLREAATADLRAWGRQRDADGRLLDLVSFVGASPLALPPDAPAATTSRVTILLAIEAESGRLREVRELIGAAGSDQTARTTWRLNSQEQVADADAANRVFDLQSSWNGVGSFDTRGAIADPSFPLADTRNLASLAQVVQNDWLGLWMPATAPPGTTSALLVSRAGGPILGPDGTGIDPNDLKLIYSSMGRRLAIETVGRNNLTSTLPSEDSETLQLNGRGVRLHPLLNQGYQAVILHTGPHVPEGTATVVWASGYTRADLIEVLRTLDTPTIETYHAQARLFADPRPRDAAFDALLGALAPPPAPAQNAATHFVERVFKRHAGYPDRLADPYHRPPYGGWPSQWLQDNWARGSLISGTLETASVTRGEDGTVYARQYRGTEVSWDYDAASSQVYQYSSQLLGPLQRSNEDQNTVLRMLGCGGYALETRPDGTRAVALSEPSWRLLDASCMKPWYGAMRSAQGSGLPGEATDQAPYLADLSDSPLTTVIVLGDGGRPKRIQTWAGLAENGTLLESWELLSTETVAPERVPADAFAQTPPDALVHLVTQDAGPPTEAPPHIATITEALDLLKTPLFVPGRAPSLSAATELTPTIQAEEIEIGQPPDQPRAQWFLGKDTVFDKAVWDGYAARLTYEIEIPGGGSQVLRLYEGRADTLRTYLRGRARWRNSIATVLEIGGKPVNGWFVLMSQSDARWVLVEIDGTLIAAEAPSLVALDSLGGLRRVDAAK